MSQSKAKSNITYRKVGRKDKKVICGFIDRAYSSGWEHENEKSAKRLAHLYFRSLMLMGRYRMVAVHRDQIVGVIFAGNRNQKNIMPITALKKKVILLKLRLSKEGRANIRNLKQKLNMQKNLIQEAGTSSGREIFMLYVKDGFDAKNATGEKLMELVLAEDTDKASGGLQVLVEQKREVAYFEQCGFSKVAEKEEMMEINRQRFRGKMFLLNKHR